MPALQTQFLRSKVPSSEAEGGCLPAAALKHRAECMRAPTENSMQKFSIALVLALSALLGFAGTATAEEKKKGANQGGASYQDGADLFLVAVKKSVVKVGKDGAIQVRISAKEGYKPNQEYPNKIKKLTASDGAVVGKSAPGTIKGKHIDFRIPVTPTVAGKHTVKGVVNFSICNDKECLVKKVNIKGTITGK